MGRGARQLEAGFTLLEIMIVVALLGVLAAIAVPRFSESRRRAANRSEVEEFFAELRVRQHQYYEENGTYLSTGTSETTTFPTAPATGGQAITSLPAAWKTLKVRQPENNPSCAYVVIAGGPSSGSVGAKGTQLGFVAPAKAWFYMLARCNADASSTTDAYFMATSETAEITKQNEDS
jgi:prepilin-type N-terminal cleavage/methylation domain-containing protein